MRFVCFFALLATTVTSTASAQTVAAALQTRFNEFVAATKGQDSGKVADFYADDAVIFDRTGVHKGRSAVIAYFRPEALKGFATMSTTLMEARSSGDLGLTFGTFAYPSNSPQKTRTGNFLLVWRRVDNQWRIAYDTFAETPAPVPAK